MGDAAELGHHQKAPEHFDKSGQPPSEMDAGETSAQMIESRARTFLAQARYAEAAQTASAAASALEGGEEQSLLAEALVTQGIALARMTQYQSAFAVLQRAAQVAEAAGDLESSARTFLTMVHELSDFLSISQISGLYQEADQRLGQELDSRTVRELRACGRLLMERIAAATTSLPAAGGSLEQEVLRHEGEWIRQALTQARGSVTRAARLLGLTHQGLCYIINTRHNSLLAARAPVRVRRKSIMKKVATRHLETKA